MGNINIFIIQLIIILVSMIMVTFLHRLIVIPKDKWKIYKKFMGKISSIYLPTVYMVSIILSIVNIKEYYIIACMTFFISFVTYHIIGLSWYILTQAANTSTSDRVCGYDGSGEINIGGGM